MPKITRSTVSLAGLLCTALLVGCAHSPPSDPWDPLEPFNRKVFTFNQTADHYVLKPVAQGYDKITPDRVQRSVSNFFANAREPVTIVSSLFQLKFDKFNIALGRFMINSSFGIGGLFDVASRLGVGKPDEDLGQVLGYWGLGPGAYLVLPLLGPSDGRDLIGRAGDQGLMPLTYFNYIDATHGYRYVPYLLAVLDLVNLRASLLGFDQTLKQQFDPYAFVRGYYLENRIELVHDGHVPAKLKVPGNNIPMGNTSSKGGGMPPTGGVQ
jgi:phospholipid-binding lipoprotein MlaA